LFLAIVGFAALLLWMCERGGLLGMITTTAMMVAIGVAGLAIVYVRFRVIVWHATDFPEHFWMVIDDLYTIAVGLLLAWSGWRWLTDPGSGIEKQKVDTQSWELVEAMDRAKSTLPYFIEQVRRHVDDAYIKFPLENDQGVIESVWAYVHHYEDGVFNVSPVNKPEKKRSAVLGTVDRDALPALVGVFGKRRFVPKNAVEDWRIMLPDDRIKGAYSYIGALQYLERTGTRLNRTMRKQRLRLVDAGPTLS
jgi:hypothetical protein